MENQNWSSRKYYIEKLQGNKQHSKMACNFWNANAIQPVGVCLRAQEFVYNIPILS